MPEPMTTAQAWDDLFAAFDFAEAQFERFGEERLLRRRSEDDIADLFDARRKRLHVGREKGWAVPDNLGLPPGLSGESDAMRRWRFWTFVRGEVVALRDRGRLSLAEFHDLIAAANARRAKLRRQLAPGEDVAEEVVVAQPLRETDDAPPAARPPRAAPAPRKSLSEYLLDPQTIQLLMALGGCVMVGGLVVLLWVNDYFTPVTIAAIVGGTNAAVLGVGWWVARGTRFALAGRGLTLLACLVMPLNLWYHDVQKLPWLGDYLWATAILITILYAASAWAVRHTDFVYVFLGGIAMTGALMLASAESLLALWSAATLFVALGTAAIFAERLFPVREGPFARAEFGWHFFRAGHGLLAVGLLAVLAAQAAGDWLYPAYFRALFEDLRLPISPLAGRLRWLGLVLALVGSGTYFYSGAVVRRVGAFVYAGAVAFAWAAVLALQELHWETVPAVVATFAGLSLAVNLVYAYGFQRAKYVAELPAFGTVPLLLGVALAGVACNVALTPNAGFQWPGLVPAWDALFGALLASAVASRFAAWLYRHENAPVAGVYLFATGAAVLLGASVLLVLCGVSDWLDRAPLLMLVPVAYCIAAWLYGGRSPAGPLMAVAHVAAATLFVVGLGSTFRGFFLVSGDPLNLRLAGFFAVGLLFYVLATFLVRQSLAIYPAAVALGAVIWQLLNWKEVDPKWYLLASAALGLALLGAYRVAARREGTAARLRGQAEFRAGNAFLFLGVVGSYLVGMSLLGEEFAWSTFGFYAALTAACAAAAWLVSQPGWRAGYLAATVLEALAAFLVAVAALDATPAEKVELFCVVAGIAILLAGHIGWYREGEAEYEAVTLALLCGSLLVGVPVAIASVIYRWRGQFSVPDECGFLAAVLVLTTTGIIFRLKATTLVGVALGVVYVLTLAVYVPWSRLNSLALGITLAGGLIFAAGLALSVLRDRLLALPERVRGRMGPFRVLGWR